MTWGQRRIVTLLIGRGAGRCQSFRRHGIRTSCGSSKLHPFDQSVYIEQTRVRSCEEWCTTASKGQKVTSPFDNFLEPLAKPAVPPFFWLANPKSITTVDSLLATHAMYLSNSNSVCPF
jgi:hypothetical protein